MLRYRQRVAPLPLEAARRLHQELLEDAAFLSGGTSIHYLEQKLAKLAREE